MDPCEKIKSNLETQLMELETLQSMFYNPGEVRVEDASVVEQMRTFTNVHDTDDTSLLPPYLDIVINLQVDDKKFELCVNLSHEYPDIEPDLFVRNHKLNKKEHTRLNRDLGDFVAGLDRGEPCIFSAISWLQDNGHNYLIDCSNSDKVKDHGAVPKNESLVRFWIYSHHIYSKTKRREIVDLAQSLNITGFSMPGKPGVICVEGTTSDCNEWWQCIKSMNWKRIFCKIIEEDKEKIRDFLKFQTFSEKVFQNNNIKCNHMDMGELFRFLDDHKCGHIFREIFGVDARASNL